MRTNSDFLVRLCYASFAVVAVILTILGALVPDITAHFSVGFDDIGALMLPALCLFLVTALLSGWLCTRYNPRYVVAGGLATMALGYLIIALAQQWWHMLLGYGIAYGLGFGITEPGLNSMVIRLRPGKEGPSLNYLHMFASLGAMLGPVIGRGAVAYTSSWQFAFLLVAVLSGLLSVAFFVSSAPELVPGNVMPSWREVKKVAANPLMFIITLTVLFYVGAELGSSQWMYSYLVESVGSNTAFAASVNSLFWLLMGVGRLASARLSERFSYETLLICYAVLAVGALSVGISGSSVVASSVGLGLTGLFFAGTFPMLMALASRANPGQTGVVSGIITFYAGLGSLAFPPSMGYVAEHVGLRAAMALALSSALLLAVLSVVLGWAFAQSKCVA